MIDDDGNNDDSRLLSTEQGVNHFKTLMMVITEILEMLKGDKNCSIKKTSAQLKKNFCSIKKTSAHPHDHLHVFTSLTLLHLLTRCLKAVLFLQTRSGHKNWASLNLRPPLTLVLVEFSVKLKLSCVLRCELPWQ